MSGEIQPSDSLETNELFDIEKPSVIKKPSVIEKISKLLSRRQVPKNIKALTNEVIINNISALKKQIDQISQEKKNEPASIILEKKYLDNIAELKNRKIITGAIAAGLISAALIVLGGTATAVGVGVSKRNVRGGSIDKQRNNQKQFTMANNVHSFQPNLGQL